jgi:ubiquinone/menaquinone biosynthesis C-methylase UbiE
MEKNIYTDKDPDYRKHNPDWHVSHSEWKAKQIIKMLRKHNLHPKKIAEVGCGAGEILNQLYQTLENDINFYGYEIAEYAYNLCQTRRKDRLEYFNENPFNSGKYFDLLLVIDVFEHIEDSYSFVRECEKTSKYKIYHIPLELFVLGIFRNLPINAYNGLGHLHFYSKDTALAMLRQCGQTIIDYTYTAGAIEAPNRTLRSKLLRLPRRILFKMNKDFCVRFLGGYSLLVLTK